MKSRRSGYGANAIWFWGLPYLASQHRNPYGAARSGVEEVKTKATIIFKIHGTESDQSDNVALVYCSSRKNGALVIKILMVIYIQRFYQITIVLDFHQNSFKIL